MVIKRKDFQKAAAFINEFLLKLNEDGECAELRDTLNLALLHMQKYYRKLQTRSHEKNAHNTLQVTARGLSPMTPFVDTPDKFQWKWLSMESFTRLASTMSVEDSMNFVRLPPIIQAAMDGELSQMEQLIQENPACIHDQDGIGRTALTYAVHFNQPGAVNCLLENEADVNLCAHDGSTALHQACHEGDVSALSLMLDFGGDLTIQDTHGRAPVHWAVTTPSWDCLQLLLEHRVDVGVRDKDGLSPSMWACRMDNINHFTLLSKADNSHVEELDGIERDANGRTWMHWAVRRTEPLECLQTLISRDTAHYKDDDGKTVLLLAAEMGSLPAAKLIIEIAGRQCLNDLDGQGRTALHLATIRGHGDLVNYLLEQGVDLTVVDSFNATAWEYARNRGLHYCQLILMSHQRQRLSSNPATPMSQGMGLIDNMPYMNGDVTHSEDYRNWRGKSDSTTPITPPPHPPKRPRTSRGLLTRRANSLTLSSSQEKIDMGGERVVNSAGNERKRERIEVSIHTGSVNKAFTSNGREETDMVTDDHGADDAAEEDVDGVSVGGMDVSDIDEDEDRAPPPTARQAPAPAPRAHVMPRPPPRLNHPRPPPQHNINKSLDMGESETTTTTTEMIDTGNRIIVPQTPPVYRSGRAGPAPSPPNITPQKPHMIRPQQPPLPSRHGPQNIPARPGVAPPRDQVVSPPPLSSGSEQGSGSKKPLSPDTGNRQEARQDTIRYEGLRQNFRQEPNRPQDNFKQEGARPDTNRPGSGGQQSKPPGVLEGRKIPPPMLTPLQNAPKAPSLSRLDKLEKKKKKKKREKREEREQETKSPPEQLQNQQSPLDIPPPRGFAAPLHPFPQQERVRSAAPSQPRMSRGNPQHHEPRYVEESEDNQHVKVNGHAVPVREGPARSARPRLQPMEEETYSGQGEDNSMQNTIKEEEEVGPLIPPPQGFRSGARYNSASQLSQSVPQDSHSSARMVPTSAKPPLPRGRSSSSSMSGRTSRNSNARSSYSRRTPRPPTSRSESNS